MGVDDRLSAIGKESVRSYYLNHITPFIQKYEDIRKLHWDIQCEIVLNLEEGCYESTIDYCSKTDTEVSWKNPEFNHVYGIRIRKLLMNLDLNSSVNNGIVPPIINRLLANIDLATTLGDLPATEINPDKSDSTREEIAKLHPEKVQYKESELYTCHFCGCKRVRMSYKQTRGGDEPEDIYVFCTNCNKRIR